MDGRREKNGGSDSAHLAVDSCVFIDYFRMRDKSKTLYSQLILRYDQFFISSIVLFEVLCGVQQSHMEFWDDCLRNIKILPFDEEAAKRAADLSIRLRKNGIQMASSDLFIAATALVNNLPLATLNRKHFEVVDELVLV